MYNKPDSIDEIQEIYANILNTFKKVLGMLICFVNGRKKSPGPYPRIDLCLLLNLVLLSIAFLEVLGTFHGPECAHNLLINTLNNVPEKNKNY